ncbi:MAG: branched-chain amino acid transporter substrate-binding protein [Burkholderiaceae bacterium]|nr:branched-chain amino acid transporter substrate-binding protein [Burkholderiaceae bacterium]
MSNPETLLAAHAVSRRFGGLRAVDEVSLSLERGVLHALIGTNGAGKSQDATNWTQPRRARAGLGRSYQRSTLFPSFTVRENCRLAAQARFPRAWDWITPAARCRDSLQAAESAIERVGLASVAERTVIALSHGERRQLEIAVCLATAPQVLLLDEPLAGMGVEESARMLELLEQLKPGHAILLVEHDMDAVFRVADLITVMVNGRVIASGTPPAVRGNAEVQRAYLGDAH